MRLFSYIGGALSQKGVAAVPSHSIPVLLLSQKGVAAVPSHSIPVLLPIQSGTQSRRMAKGLQTMLGHDITAMLPRPEVAVSHMNVIYPLCSDCCSLLQMSHMLPFHLMCMFGIVLAPAVGEGLQRETINAAKTHSPKPLWVWPVS